MMSALSILTLVLPFPVLFLIHEAEEVVVQHRWMLAHKQELTSKFPKMQAIIENLAGLSTKAFAVAASEEFLLLLLATLYVMIGGKGCMPIWAALFMAFSLHLLVHLGQAIAVRGYVPGIVTSIVLLPFAAYGAWSIWLAMSALEFALCSIAGVVFMAVNLRFAHWLGNKLFNKSRQ
ncbi:MAG: HXXEE domain-containing protein [Muribaculaceae bacterium]